MWRDVTWRDVTFKTERTHDTREEGGGLHAFVNTYCLHDLVTRVLVNTFRILHAHCYAYSSQASFARILCSYSVLASSNFPYTIPVKYTETSKTLADSNPLNCIILFYLNINQLDALNFL